MKKQKWADREWVQSTRELWSVWPPLTAMSMAHPQCMKFWPFSQQRIEFVNIKPRKTELPPTCYSTMILPDSWPNAEKKNKARTCISECWDKNTSCLVAYQHFCFKLTGIFPKIMALGVFGKPFIAKVKWRESTCSQISGSSEINSCRT